MEEIDRRRLLAEGRVHDEAEPKERSVISKISFVLAFLLVTYFALFTEYSDIVRSLLVALLSADLVRRLVRGSIWR